MQKSNFYIKIMRFTYSLWKNSLAAPTVFLQVFQFLHKVFVYANVDKLVLCFSHVVISYYYV